MLYNRYVKGIGDFLMEDDISRRLKEGRKFIFETYGEDGQFTKLLEEVLELGLALVRNDIPNVVEELADVLNVAEGLLENVPALKATISGIQLKKVERQLERIENGRRNREKELNSSRH